MESVFIQKNTYQEAFKELKRIVGSRVVDLKKKHYVLVPGNFTLFAEKLFFKGGGALDVGVYSFDRLFSKLITSESYLPRHGAVMLLKKVINENAGKLKFFTRSCSFNGFAEKMYDTISVLVNCMVQPQMLKTGREIDLKLDDIKLIYEKYLEAAGEKYIDASGRLSLLLKAVTFANFKEYTFYFAGYDGFTKQESAVVAAITKKAEKTIIISAKEFEPDFKEAEFYSAPDIADQIKAAAKRIRAAVKEQNLSYGDMCMIAPPDIYMTAKRLLSEFDIPFYIDHKLNIGEQTLSKYLYSLYRLADKGINSDDIFKLCKNYFFRIAKEDADIFENYCLKFCVDYDRFLKPFSYFKNMAQNNSKEIKARDLKRLLEQENTAEKVRKKIEKAHFEFSLQIKQEMMADDFYALIENTLKNCGAEDVSAELSNAAGIDVKMVPDKIKGCAGLLARIFPKRVYKSELLFDLFFEGLIATKVPLIPKTRDALTIGDANVFRAGGYKYMFVIDFCDGVVPLYSKDCALISDSEIDILSGEGVEIEPKISKINARNADDFFFAASAVPKLFLAYSDTGEKKISSAALTIERNAKKVIKNSFEQERYFLYECDAASVKNYDRIARHCSSKGNASEMFLISAGELKTGQKGLPFASEIIEAAGKDFACKYLDEHIKDREEGAVTDGFIKDSAIKNLFFKSDSTSITALQDYFLCPRYNFLKNGLNIKEREDGRMSPLDIGNFLHSAVEEFVKNNRYDDTDGQMNSIADRITEGNETYLLEANKVLIARAKAEAVRIARVLAEQIQCSNYIPKFFEAPFGYDENDDFKPLKLKAGGREITIRGKIDRADVYKDYIRVIDYKTGKPSSAEFDFKKAYFGRQIQLLVYMRVAMDKGFKCGGLFYFPCSSNWDDNEFSHRLSGLCNSDPDIVLATDRNLIEQGYKSKIINAKAKKDKKRGEPGGSSFSGYGLFSKNQIENFCEYAVNIAANAAREISDGFTGAYPLDNACSFCALKTACGKEEKDIKTRETHKVRPADILSLFNSDADGNANGKNDLNGGDNGL